MTHNTTDINIATDAIDTIITSMKNGNVTDMSIAVDRLEEVIYQLSREGHYAYTVTIREYMRESMQ